MSDHGSVLSWLENIQNPIAIRQDQYPYADRGTTAGKRKRSPEEDLSSRHASPRLRALAETSGNIMPNGNMEDSEDDLASTQHPQVSPAYKRQPRTTPSYPSTTRSRPRAGQDLQSLQSQRAGENQKAEIFQKAMGRNEERDAQNKADLGEATPGGLYFGKAFAPMLPRPQTRDMSISSPTHGSANEDLSSTRSRSPVKKMVDLSFAKRPTKYRDLDGRVAQNLGGVLDKYARLVKISRGEEVIPLQLKV